jgi:sec-independent protein translocase protein TatA
MGSLSIWHILILATIVLVLFGGRGKVSDLMGDVGKGIKSFRAGLNDPEQVSLQQSQPRAIAPQRHEDRIETPSTMAAPANAD